jgi:hypothetical protein
MENQTFLIKRYQKYDENSLSDWIIMMAAEVEDAYLEAGGQPNIDYTFHQIMEAAVRLVIAKQTNEIIKTSLPNLEHSLDHIQKALYEIDSNVMMLRAK